MKIARLTTDHYKESRKYLEEATEAFYVSESTEGPREEAMLLKASVLASISRVHSDLSKDQPESIRVTDYSRGLDYEGLREGLEESDLEEKDE